MTADSKLLEPLTTVVTFVLGLVIAGLAVGFAASLFVPGVHVGWDTGTACATNQHFLGSVGDHTDQVYRPKGGATVGVIPQYCTSNPTGYQRRLVLLDQAPTFVMAVGSLLWLNRLLRNAAREGVHTNRTITGIKRFAWWLLIGGLVVAIIRANAQAALLATLTSNADYTPWTWLNGWSFPTGMVFTSVGLFTFARIVRAGVVMREDLEGTV